MGNDQFQFILLLGITSWNFILFVKKNWDVRWLFGGLIFLSSTLVSWPINLPYLLVRGSLEVVSSGLLFYNFSQNRNWYLFFGGGLLLASGIERVFSYLY